MPLLSLPWVMRKVTNDIIVCYLEQYELSIDTQDFSKRNPQGPCIVCCSSFERHIESQIILMDMCKAVDEV